ncbi:MAG TPA: glycosyltransferase family 2 protein [Usitatibacter sp.]|nr:glycosyltransferase family 2 protein [Usitatibacter sp.]
MKTISIVVPCRNEEHGIAALMSRLEALQRGIAHVRFEVVLVNDGSTDGTLDRMLEAKAGFAGGEVVVVDLSRNFGKEAALSAGLAVCAGEAAIPLDADLQDPPELIAGMVGRWEAGAEVVLARRTDRSSDTWFKRASARAFYAVQNATSDVAIPAHVGDFRLMDRAVVDVINALPENRRYMKGLFAWAGFRTECMDYVRPARASGSTQFNALRLARLALEGLTSFSLAPLRLATVVGAAVALVALVKSAQIAIRTLIYGVDVPGYASIFTAVAFLGGFQLFCLGIIGEYVGRTYLEAKRRPAFVVRRVFR